LGAASQLAVSANDEWAALVTASIIGTDRRPPPPPRAGWDTWATSPDPAVALLDRAFAVVLARRAGACPSTTPLTALRPAPSDPRPPCPASCALRLRRLLDGEHVVVMPEWFEQCDRAGFQLPAALLPTLLLRGRRDAVFDQLVRRLAGGRAAWLAEAVPELGITPRGPAAPAATPPPNLASANVASANVASAPPAVPTDGGAVVSAIVQLFVEGLATWAAAAQLRNTVAALDPTWLPALVVELSRLSYAATTERTRAELLSLAEFRSAMLREFALAPPLPGHIPPAHPFDGSDN
jgi:hypothetical protein